MIVEEDVNDDLYIFFYDGKINVTKFAILTILKRYNSVALIYSVVQHGPYLLLKPFHHSKQKLCNHEARAPHFSSFSASGNI